MTKILISSIFMLLLSVYGCQTDPNHVNNTPPSATVNTPPEVIKGTALLDRCIAAHGGMEAWNKFSGLSYTIQNNGKSLYQLTELKDRRSYTKTNDYELGCDGKMVWVTPGPDKVPGKSAAFYYNLDFYFVAIPFVLKDPGVQATYLGKAAPDGQEYEVLKISFDPNTGSSAEDLYFLYLDPASHQLKILTYTVSYFDKNNQQVNSAKRYLDYKNVQGILMPQKMENYRWINKKIGEKSNRDRVISNIIFYEKIEDPSIFDVPVGAVTESL